jgi:hypothetical protein
LHLESSAAADEILKLEWELIVTSGICHLNHLLQVFVRQKLRSDELVNEAGAKPFLLMSP